MKNLHYLASPYTHVSAVVRFDRFLAACRATAALTQRGLLVFSPIIHSVPQVQMADGIGTLWTDWADIDGEWVRRADAVLVLTLPGWAQSIGVWHELTLAKQLCLPVQGVAPGPEYELFDLPEGLLDQVLCRGEEAV